MRSADIVKLLAAIFVLSSSAVDLSGKGKRARGSEKTRKRARQRRQSGKGKR